MMNLESKQKIERIVKQFKRRGLALTKGASLKLLSQLDREDDNSFNDKLNTILKNFIERGNTKGTIDENELTMVVAEMTEDNSDLFKQSIELYDAFSSPRIIYDEKLKTYKVNKKSNLLLFGGSDIRAKMYRERLLLMQQRLLRQGFTFKSITSKAENGLVLSPIDSLLGSEGPKAIYGVLSQPYQDEWYLEDLTGMIKLNGLNNAMFHRTDRIYAEGCIVLVEGELEGNEFIVKQMGFTSHETRKQSLDAMGIVDVFGDDKRLEQMREQEIAMSSEEVQDQMFIILSDVKLDKQGVLDKLKELFDGYENVFESFEDGECLCPPLFILIGSFTTKTLKSSASRTEIISAYNNLANVISSCPWLAQNAKFLFIPGPEDPIINNVLPQRPIPDQFTKDLRKKVKHITFASNPCRIRYFSEEIVLFREDLLKRMQRHTVPIPKDDDASNKHLIDTILEQGHLLPLPLAVRPIYWDLDHVLRLNPLPNVLVLADHAEQYQFVDFDPMANSVIMELGYNDKQQFINDYDNGAYSNIDDISEDAIYTLNSIINNNDITCTPIELLRSVRSKLEKELPEGTIAFNPGSFSCDFSFNVYYPAKRLIDNCNV